MLFTCRPRKAAVEDETDDVSPMRLSKKETPPST
jgi:hypothetical protein